MARMMTDQDKETQECMWSDRFDLPPGSTLENKTNPSHYFGSYTNLRRWQLRNRLKMCFDYRYCGRRPLTLYCSEPQLQGGVCAGCDVNWGAHAYHGDVYHICWCDGPGLSLTGPYGDASEEGAAACRLDTRTMIHETFHWIPPGFPDTHWCAGSGYDWPHKFYGTENVEKLQACPVDALNNPDSYAVWLSNVAETINAGGAWWPGTCDIGQNDGVGGGGGGGDLDCNPYELDGWCILNPQEDEGLPP